MLLILAIIIGHYQPHTSLFFIIALSALTWQLVLAFLDLQENWEFHVYTFRKFVKKKLKLGGHIPYPRKYDPLTPEEEALRKAAAEERLRAAAEYEEQRERERTERKQREEQEKLELRKKLELKTAAEALKEGMEDLL